jgi:NADPH:quinone reductase-like Zn-dependent oxidoreductase
MKAVIFNEHGGLEVLKCTDIDKPTAGEGQVVIKNEYAGVRLPTALAGHTHRPHSIVYSCKPLQLLTAA